MKSYEEWPCKAPALESMELSEFADDPYEVVKSSCLALASAKEA